MAQEIAAFNDSLTLGILYIDLTFGIQSVFMIYFFEIADNPLDSFPIMKML